MEATPRQFYSWTTASGGLLPYTKGSKWPKWTFIPTAVNLPLLLEPMKKLLVLLLILFSGPSDAAPVHQCAVEAVKQAERLLKFHIGPDDRIEIDKNIKVLAPIKNPANKAQVFDVLEVWGNVYKGQYRMHLIYARSKDSCLLMGQEILEFASL